MDYIRYAKNTTGGYYEFNFAYSSPEAAACNGTGDFSTQVTDVSDSQGGTTTYCADTSDKVLKVIDPPGHSRSTRARRR